MLWKNKGLGKNKTAFGPQNVITVEQEAEK